MSVQGTRHHRGGRRARESGRASESESACGAAGARLAHWHRAPRGLALDLHHAYGAVLGMREAMWDELVLQLREERRVGELLAVGWDQDEAGDEPRAAFDVLLARYAADMHARTSVRDALREGLGWAPPRRHAAAATDSRGAGRGSQRCAGPAILS